MKKNFKKIISLCMATVMVTVLAVAVNAKTVSYDNMEAISVFATNGNLTGHSFEITDTDQMHGKSYRITTINRGADQWEDSAAIYTNLPEAISEGTVVISFQQKRSDVGTIAYVALNPETKTAVGSYSGEIKSAALDSTLRYFDSAEGKTWNYATTNIPAVADTWYQVDIVIDFDGKTISYYYDGVLAGTRALYTGLTQLKCITIAQNSQKNVADSRDMYIDNFEVKTVEPGNSLKISDVIINENNTNAVLNLSDTIVKPEEITIEDIIVTERFSDEPIEIQNIETSPKGILVEFSEPLSGEQEYLFAIDKAMMTAIDGLVHEGVKGRTFIDKETEVTQHMPVLDFSDGTENFNAAAANTNAVTTDGVVDTGEAKYGNAYQLNHKVSSTFSVLGGSLMQLGDYAIQKNSGKYELSYDIKVTGAKWDQWNPRTWMSIGFWGAQTNPGLTKHNNWLGYWENMAVTSVMGTVGNVNPHYWTYSSNTSERYGSAKVVTATNKAWCNVKMIFDTSNNTIDYYYNDTFAGTQNVAATGNGGVTMKTGAIGVIQFTSETTNSEVTQLIDNIQIKKITEYPNAESITFEDSNGKEYFAGATVTSAVNKINIKFNDVVTEEQMSQITLSEAGTDLGLIPVVDAESKTAVLDLDGYLTPGAVYTLSMFGKEYTFTAKSGEFAISGFKVIKEDGTVVNDSTELSVGDKVRVVVDILNTTGENKDLLLSIASYNGNKMSAVAQSVVTADEVVSVRETDLIEITDATNLKVKGFVWDNVTSMMPQIDAVVID